MILELKQRAIETVRVMIDRGKMYADINKAICDVCGDFSPTIQAQDHEVERAVVFLLDGLLGHELASYYLYEAKRMEGGGCIQHADGTEYPIKTLEDVLKYSVENDK